MKKLTFLLSAIILFSFGCNNKPESEVVYTTTIGMGTPYFMMPEILNGKVKEVTEKIYFATEENGTYVKGERMTQEAKDTLSWTASYIAKFDQDGNLMSSTEIDDSDKPYNLNESDIMDGKIIGGKFFYKDTLRVIFTRKYYPADHSAMYERIRMPEDTLINKIKVVYDSLGAYKTWEFFNSSGDPTYRYEFTAFEGIVNGVKAMNKDGEQVFESHADLNDHGFAYRDVIINRSGELESTMEYTYDDMGNWTTRIVKTPEVVVIEERAITYYDDEAEGSGE